MTQASVLLSKHDGFGEGKGSFTRFVLTRPIVLLKYKMEGQRETGQNETGERGAPLENNLRCLVCITVLALGKMFDSYSPGAPSSKIPLAFPND